jgi:hypothetical protein
MKRPYFPSAAVFLCNGSKCGKHKDFRKALKSNLKQVDGAELFLMECSDRCKFAPVLCVQPQNAWYFEADESDLPSIQEDLKTPL